jgi:hypothetical protein
MRSSIDASGPGTGRRLGLPAIVLTLLAFAAAGFLADRLLLTGSVEQPVAAANHLESGSAGPRPAAGPAQRRPGAFPRFAVSNASSADAGAEASALRERAASVFAGLFQRLDVIKRAMPQATPEARVNNLRPFIAGMAEGIRQVNPQLTEALAEELRSRLCQQRPSADEAILLAYLGSEMPEATSVEAFDCFFASAGAREDAPLWYMLDAWRDSGQGAPPALAQIRARAVDPRTLRRLQPGSDAARRALSSTQSH